MSDNKAISGNVGYVVALMSEHFETIKCHCSLNGIFAESFLVSEAKCTQSFTMPLRCTSFGERTQSTNAAVEAAQKGRRSERVMPLLPRNQYPGALLMSELYKKLFIPYIIY